MIRSPSAPLLHIPTDVPPGDKVQVALTRYGDQAVFALLGSPDVLAPLCGSGDAADLRSMAARHPDKNISVVASPALMCSALKRLLNTSEDDQHQSVYAMADLLAAAEQAIADGHVLPEYTGYSRWRWRIVVPPSARQPLCAAAATVASSVLTPPSGVHGPFDLTELAENYALDHAALLAADLVIPSTLPTKPSVSEALTPTRTFFKSLAAGDSPVLILSPPANNLDWSVTFGLRCSVDGTVYLYEDLVSRTEVPHNDHFWAHRGLFEAEFSALDSVVSVPGLTISASTVLKGKKLSQFCDQLSQARAGGVEVLTPQGQFMPRPARTTVHVSGSAKTVLSAGLELRVSTSVDGVEVSPEDLDMLVAAAPGALVELSSGWARVPDGLDAAKMAAQLAVNKISAVELLGADFGSADLIVDDIPGIVGEILQGKTQLSAFVPVDPPPTLKSPLRDYQLKGLQWLSWCEQNNVGGILADQMGLGKTVQVLSRISLDHPGPTLVICPTSLLDNWVSEVAKFTPDLSVSVFHGPERDLSTCVGSDIVLSTYTLLGSDPALLSQVWHRVVLDEAQAIKNPATKAARAARKLSATHRFAMTGTPVENHVGDLWSLMAFAYPQLFGSYPSFRRRFLNPDMSASSRLRTLLTPFVLRRTKTDRKVISDLPDKVTLTHHCGLTRPQMGAYEAVVRSLKTLPATTPAPLARKGAVLAALTKLKQVCVHPQLADGTHRGGLSASSAKLSELAEIVSAAKEDGEAVLVFTQFASFLPTLATWLRTNAHASVVVLDGSMSRTARAAAVAQFNKPNGPDVFCVSLRAGGVGLNLVRANHVVHLDRWWNPAVEDQASDRVWRIGQTRNVLVHNLVCAGTVEERIDDLLTDKRATAQALFDVDQVAAKVLSLTDAQLVDFVTYTPNQI